MSRDVSTDTRHNKGGQPHYRVRNRLSRFSIERHAVNSSSLKDWSSAHSPSGNDGRTNSRRQGIFFLSYGIEWPRLVCTDCRSGLSIIPLRLISSRKLAAVIGWPRSA
jgi:hypothetical protein